MDGRILAPDDPAWGEHLAACDHDVHHLPGFARLEAARLGGEARLFVVRQGAWSLALPLVVAPVVVDDQPVPAVSDARSPYGYPGPLTAGQPPNGWLRDAVFALVELAAGESIAALFVRLHTLLPWPREALAAAGRLVTHGETVWIDLTLSEAELWSQTRPSDRNRINKLRKSGLVATIDEAWTGFDDFLEVYAATMRHTGAADWYFFDREYFEGLRAAMGPHLHLCTVCDGARVQAAGLFTECCGLVQFHLSGTADEFRATSPSRLMVDHVRTWAKARGNRRFNLGGGLGAAADSLFDFKAGFSKLRATFETWRAVANPEAYARAAQAWERKAGRAADPIDGYFPPWRRPIG